MSPHPTPPDPGEREALRAEVHPDRTAVDAPDGVEVRLRVPCARYGDRVMSIDVFTPSVAPAAPRPAIVFVHGGAWVKGSPSQFHHQAGYLAARHGFLAVSAEYRFADEAPFPAALQDIKCAMRWVRAHAREYNVDPGRVAVAGGSSGAHLAPLVLTTADVPEYEGAGGYEGFDSAANAGVLFNGEFDLPTLIEMGSLAGCLQRFLGGSLKDVPERYAKASSARRMRLETTFHTRS